ncbi:hypothetical protein F511_37046 [Dorcoceras hygrometricum]|uniref:Uncharacterized protein n=1 Tax=Dorcoceras hygrometricum TaxID=472368 RepID=A0A2Z7C8I4_9LAMI|nr:hypothetical protein F511_37046 [Dorcoceras hygrometricum]
MGTGIDQLNLNSVQRTKTSTSDEDSMSIDDILKRILEEMMLPSYPLKSLPRLNLATVFRSGKGLAQVQPSKDYC